MKKIVLISFSLIIFNVFMYSSSDASDSYTCSGGNSGTCPPCQTCQQSIVGYPGCTSPEISATYFEAYCGYNYSCVLSSDPSCKSVAAPAPQPTPASAWDTVINEANRVSCVGSFDANTTPCDALWRALGNYCTISGNSIATALSNLTGQSVVNSQSCDINPDGSDDPQSCVTICNITDAVQGPSSCPQLCEGYCPTNKDTGRSGRRLWIAPFDRYGHHQRAVTYYNMRHFENNVGPSKDRNLHWCKNSMEISPVCTKQYEEKRIRR